VIPVGAINAPVAPPAGAPRTDEGSPERKAALAFERQLVLQLTKQLAETAKADEESAGGAAQNAYLDMLPETLADAVVNGGGIGLADQLAPALTEDAAP
jgi:Rod binding domain-containing protein